MPNHALHPTAFPFQCLSISRVVDAFLLWLRFDNLAAATQLESLGVSSHPMSTAIPPPVGETLPSDISL